MITGWVWTLGTIELVLSAIFVTAFVALYGLSRPWWRSEIGKQMMLSKSTFMVVLWFASISSVYAHYGWHLPHWWMYARLGAFGVVPIAFAWLLIILVKRLRKTHHGG